MSKMAELRVEIEALVEQGFSPQEISMMLGCLDKWVEEIWETRMYQERELTNQQRTD